MNHAWWTPFAAYLLGSIPFGYLIVRRREGRDVRATGSGNIGAANVTRVAGAASGVLTLSLDAAKGYAAVWIAGRVAHGAVAWIAAAAVAAVLGHMFPIWLRFKGGKGVATGFGVFLAISPEAVAAAFVLWIAVLLFWRYISLASISAAAVLPFLLYLLYAPPHAPPRILSAGALFVCAMIVIRHRGNLERLVRGSEPRFHLGRKKTDPS